MMKNFSLICVSLFALNLAQAKPAIKILEFSVENQPVMSVTVLKYVKIDSEPFPEVKDVSKETTEGFSEVHTKPSQTKKLWDIGFGLTPEDADKLQKLTEQNIGKHLDILIKGRKVISPTINAAIPNGLVNLSVPDEKQARQIYKSLKTIESK